MKHYQLWKGIGGLKFLMEIDTEYKRKGYKCKLVRGISLINCYVCKTTEADYYCHDHVQYLCHSCKNEHFKESETPCNIMMV
jgi:hypothetical protein